MYMQESQSKLDEQTWGLPQSQQTLCINIAVSQICREFVAGEMEP